MNWPALRADLNGSQQRAFEELCVQLARIETETLGPQFVRHGTPDGGIEGYRVLPNGDRLGWQAKFFLGNVDRERFRQLDESVRRALETQPRLVRYTICIPQDRADPGKPDEEWFMDRWDAAVERWSGWAAAKGMNVLFDYWGDSELDQLLREERHTGRLWLWFGERALTHQWLRDAFAVTKRDAGQRYDPDVNVPLPIADLLTGLLRERPWFVDLSYHGGSIDRILWQLREIERDPRFAQETGDVLAVIRDGLATIRLTGRDPSSRLALDDAIDFFARAENHIYALRRRLEEVPLTDAEQARPRHVQREDYRRPTEQYALWRLDAAVDSMLDLLRSKRARLAAGAPLVITGDAGTGKTHLLCDAVNERLDDDAPAIVMLGQWFNDDDPLQRMVWKLHLGCTPPVFLAALSSIAEARQRRALIAIDALNDARPRRVWRDNLAGFLTVLARYPWIGVVLSCRTSYVRETFPDGRIPDEAVAETHRGFGEKTFAAVRRYFDHYGIARPRIPLVMPEFRNPLFLRLFCRAMSGRAEVPIGANGVMQVFEAFVASVDEKLSGRDELDYNPALRPLQRTLDALVDAMLADGSRRLPLVRANEIAESIRPSPTWSRSILWGLETEGILVSEAPFDGADSREYISFQYERLGDYLLTRRLLDGLSAQDLARSFTDGRLAPYLRNDRWDARGILEALAVHLPEAYGMELHDVAALDFDAFLTSLIWRRTDAFTESAAQLINRALADPRGSPRIYGVCLTVAGQPGHALGGAFLNQHLRNFNMVQRDALWTSYVNDADDDAEPYQLVEWALSVGPGDGYDEEPLFAAGLALTWLLTASNRRIRDRATKALAQLLTDHMSVARRLLHEFADVNDPYVLERLAAAAYGAVTRTGNHPGAIALAHVVFDTFFATSTRVPVHILTRDYLRGIIELAYHRGEYFTMELVRPPYGATFGEPPPWETFDGLAQRAEPAYNSGLDSVFGSVKHLDFALYIIGTNGGHFDWLPIRLGELPPEQPDAIVARFEDDLNDDQQFAWRQLRSIDDYRIVSFQIVHSPDEAPEQGPVFQYDHRDEEFRGQPIPDVDEAMATFRATLGEQLEHRFDEEVRPVLDAPRGRPRFDLSLVQRAVMGYVVETGYDATLSLYDDGMARGHYTRQPRSRERIGKKYQWQGLHETLARIADNFVFAGSGWHEAPAVYDGPWQTSRRDIDPTFIDSEQVKDARRVDRAWDRIAPAISVGTLDGTTAFEEAFQRLFKQDVAGVRWLLLDGYYDWNEDPPLDRDRTSVPRRNVWTMIRPYLIHASDVEGWFAWAVRSNWDGRWMRESADLHTVFRGEFYWAPAFHAAIAESSSDWSRETQTSQSVPVEVYVPTVGYFAETGTSDGSLEKTQQIVLPALVLAQGLDLRWNGDPWSLQDTSGGDVAVSASTEDHDGRGLWIREDVLRLWLEREGLSLVWTILSEASTLYPFGGVGATVADDRVYTGTAVLDPGDVRLAVRRAEPRRQT